MTAAVEKPLADPMNPRVLGIKESCWFVGRPIPSAWITLDR